MAIRLHLAPLMALAASLALAAGCADAPLELPGFAATDFVAALTLDETGGLVAASEVRPLGGGIDLFVGDGPVVVVGWSPAALGVAGPATDVPLAARVGCSPRVPTPERALRLDGELAPTAIDAATLPALSAPWAESACGTIDPARYAFWSRCKNARCPWVVRSTGACTFDVELSCLGSAISARVDPDGTLCTTSAIDPGTTAEDACVAQSPPPPAISSLDCTVPEACTIDAYAAPDAPPILIERVAVSSAARLVPPTSLTGVLGKLPVSGHLVGLAHDMAVIGDRVVVSTATVAWSTGCGDARLHAYALDDLRPLATATAARCLLTLAAAGDRVIGVSTNGATFQVDAYTPELARVAAVELDARVTVRPGEPPLSRPECERPIEVVVTAAHVVVVMARATPTCGGNPSTVHVLDRATLAPVAHLALDGAQPYRAKLIGDALWIAESGALRLASYRLPDGARLRTLDVPPGFARTDVALFDFARDTERDEWVVATIRDQPAIRREGGDGPFADRAFFLTDEADPVALWSAPFAGDRGLVLGTRDGNAAWPTEAALYDRASFVVLPGGVPVGYGPPRRLLPDGHGGVLVLFPWEAALVRLRPAASP